ncbi:hypothetical protein [Mucilaginibacter agri]|uniref:hypothetical protein n=1 Tax=Mucilaginibacter agri TaxID=2695265 RepID=UPI001AA120CA|nr:hypothetical protein [Mucilaginibacter agri]
MGKHSILGSLPNECHLGSLPMYPTRNTLLIPELLNIPGAIKLLKNGVGVDVSISSYVALRIRMVFNGPLLYSFIANMYRVTSMIPERELIAVKIDY